jgi:hypothetical protein
MIIIDGSDVKLNVNAAIGTIADCVEREYVKGSFDDFRYCVANGREVLLGHHQVPQVKPGEIREMRTSDSSVNSVFVSKGPNHHRSASTWEELREYLREGWVIGTERYPGVKFWFVSSGRNSRREANRIFIV